MCGPVLPEELLVEILSRLPVKDLMRFRCVSKSWNSLVFDPTFVKLHLQRSSKSTHILLTFDTYDEYDECSHGVAPCSIHGLLENPPSTLDDCHPLHHDYTVSVLGVCNGLVCLHNSYYGYDFKEFRFIFWNPATRIVSQDSPRIRLRTRYYNQPDFYRFGFGYDCWSHTYQLVVLYRKSQKMEVKVHCLGDTCWRNTLTCPSFRPMMADGASVSGTVNWLALPNLKSSYAWEDVTINELVIFSYDLKNETYTYLSMPHGLSEVPSHVPKLEVLKGCLCLSHCDRRNYFVVWLMREFGVENSWTQFPNISCEQIHVYDYIQPFLAILCMSDNDDLMLLANYDSREFILYNKRDNRIDWCKGFDDIEDFNYSYGQFVSYDYVQSLVLPY